MKDFFLEANPNPERIGCPEESTIKALAEGRLPVSHPARLHLASCSECFAEFRGFKGDWEEIRTRRLWILGLALAASLIVVTGLALREYVHARRGQSAAIQMTAAQPAAADVDLFNFGTVRGENYGINPLKQVSLPATIVQLSVTLPRFSEAGKYAVLVSRDKSGKQIVAEGSGNAVANDGKVTLGVTLNLRSAKPGAYFLATIRGSDNGMYYYPVQISPGAR
jgi:predicted outer membrane lipoprotein